MTNQIKKPVHPGIFLHDILLSENPISFSEIDNMAKYLEQQLDDVNYYTGIEAIKGFLSGRLSLNHVVAYKLAVLLYKTDVRFWMDLQREYDEWEAVNKKEAQKVQEKNDEIKRLIDGLIKDEIIKDRIIGKIHTLITGSTLFHVSGKDDVQLLSNILSQCADEIMSILKEE